MKKIHFIIITILALSTTTIMMVFNPSKAICQKQITQTSYTIPRNVMDIFRNSCIACHGESGNFSARSTMNFYVWDNYSAEKQLIKARAIINALTKETMPPASARNNTPQNIPTADRIVTVGIWANSLDGK
jgi:hypothetical protein